MNVMELKDAAEDLIEAHGASPYDLVYVKGTTGAEPIDGFEITEANEFSGVFVLGSNGEPVVSSKVVEQKDKEIERLRHAISWGVSCVYCSNQLAEDWNIVEGTFICGECKGDME